MDYSILPVPATEEKIPTTYSAVKTAKQESLWQQLQTVMLEESLDFWYGTLPESTARSYQAGFYRLFELEVLQKEINLQQFSLLNHETIIDQIKLIQEWSEATRQARAAAFISFTGFLQRRTQSIIKKATANKEGANKTFFKVREKVKTNPLSKEQTPIFLNALEKINRRDALIAKLILQGGKRKGEVLELTIDGIDFYRNQITYRQSKTRGMEKVTVINYPKHVMDELVEYTNGRTGLVFVTRNGKKIAPFQIDRNFLKAGELAGIPFRVTPHVLRVTLVTRLKELKVQDTDIMKITGHANPAQLSSYDRSDLGNNASADFSFV